MKTMSCNNPEHDGWDDALEASFVREAALREALQQLHGWTPDNCPIETRFGNCLYCAAIAASRPAATEEEARPTSR